MRLEPNKAYIARGVEEDGGVLFHGVALDVREVEVEGYPHAYQFMINSYLSPGFEVLGDYEESGVAQAVFFEKRNGRRWTFEPLTRVSLAAAAEYVGAAAELIAACPTDEILVAYFFAEFGGD